MEDFERQAAQRDVNLSEEITDPRKQLQESIMAQLAWKELVSDLWASLLNAERRANHLTMELAEGLYLWVFSMTLLKPHNFQEGV